MPIMKREFRNIFAVLAHEKPESVHDLALNLKFCDPSSEVLLYDSSIDKHISRFSRWQDIGVELIPNPQPLLWGDLLEFATASIEYLGSRKYDSITFVDSDQLMINTGYSEFLSSRLDAPFGVLSIYPHRHGIDSNILAVRDLHAEWDLWAPYIKRFNNWQEAFVRWTFWPGTVVSGDAARDIAQELRSPALREILSKSRAWATEECIIPTVSYLLGHQELPNPCDRRWCRFRTPWSSKDLQIAMEVKDAFFMHPVNRSFDDPIRSGVRQALGLPKSEFADDK